ncbi:hypothetical protein PG997_006980 [Apiospora hydei]|uniref:Transposase n=1 Tax=Apiospora hydei TaxID=1337664 RepID=A0ABR1WQ94_9PEZI
MDVLGLYAMLRSTYVTSPQELCRRCGTPSTFSDMVRIALRDSVHTTEFMIDGITRNHPGKGITQVQPRRY